MGWGNEVHSAAYSHTAAYYAGKGSIVGNQGSGPGYGNALNVGGGYGGGQSSFSGYGTRVPTYTPDVTGQQTQYQQAIAQLQAQAQGVQAAAGRASKAADFFSPERGQYITALRRLMTTGKSQVGYDPSYQFRFKQGQGAVESSLAAQGLLGSGRAGLELQKYGQQAASQEYQAQYQRLFQLAGVSQSSPQEAARLQLEGARAPMEAAGQVAGFSLQSMEGEKGRAMEQSQAAVQHQYDLQKMQMGSMMSGRSTGYSVGGGGAHGTPLTGEQLNSLAPFDWGKINNVGYGQQIAQEQAKFQERAIFGGY